ncbi:MAG: tyrosyl-DNA phosphodiesterase 1 [Chitinophagaceae bacterium]|nr:tyrosyl-DNA phosphodiesterase 1 [Chitinophagaceae bacterium]
MRFIIFLLVISPLFGASQPSKEDKKGRIQVERLPFKNDSCLVTGAILDFLSNEKLKLCDFWINNKRYDCDSSCNFLIFLNPGRYIIEARSFGYENLKYKFRIKKNEQIRFRFYLFPFKSKKLQKNIH